METTVPQCQHVVRACDSRQELKEDSNATLRYGLSASCVITLLNRDDHARNTPNL